MSIPAELRYTNEHEWVRVEDGVATIGITHHAQDQLGDIVYLELPKVGDTVEANETIGEIEAVKAVAELYSPLSGEIVAIN